MSVLFERFISRERNEPPDIDVDFEHQRREEVIQYIYAKYGRDRAALTAVVISYRPAARCATWAARWAWTGADRRAGQGAPLVRRRAGRRPAACATPAGPRRPARAPVAGDRRAADRLSAPPEPARGRLRAHAGPLTRLVPVENAAMPDRSIIQWDKDDLDAVGLLKVDVLALGMLSAIRRCLALVSREARRGLPHAGHPRRRPRHLRHDLRADTVGVFQIESRAQMSMLPRLKPRCFYDLVIEVAIVRPGPIQGGMVHPYLRRRQGLEPVDYPSEALREALGRTLGVPIFQEQVMQIAMLAAGFSAGEADSLRRSMAAWKRKGGVHKFHDRMVGGMVERGYTKHSPRHLQADRGLRRIRLPREPRRQLSRCWST
jgi:error-prone DNA polymerase